MYKESFFAEAQFFPRLPCLRCRFGRQADSFVRALSGFEEKYRYFSLQLSKFKTSVSWLLCKH